MKVLIAYCSRNTYWYANRIGKIYEVRQGICYSSYDVIDDSIGIKMIDKCDCVVLTDKECLELEVASKQKELDELKAKLDDLGKITKEDIKDGAEIAIPYGDGTENIVCVLKDVNMYRMSGRFDNKYELYPNQWTLNEMVDYLNGLKAVCIK